MTNTLTRLMVWASIILLVTTACNNEQEPSGPIAPSTEQTSTATPTEAPAEDLVDLLARQRVEAEVTGADIQSVNIRLRPTGPVSPATPVRVEIVAGTFFSSGDSSKQNMVATTSRTIDLAYPDWIDVTLSAACANQPRDVPDSDDQFTVKRLPEQNELAKAAKALAAADAQYPVIQAAIWIISDNANYDDLGVLIGSTEYDSTGGTRVIDEADTAEALQILDGVGIDIKKRRIWNDRNRIAQAVDDTTIKGWLNSR